MPVNGPDERGPGQTPKAQSTAPTVASSVMNSVSLRVCGSQLTTDRYIVHVRTRTGSLCGRAARMYLTPVPLRR